MLSANVTESETNNAQSTANEFELPADGIVHLLGTSRGKNDRDFFTFSPTEDVQAKFSLSPSAGLPIEFKLTDASGKQTLVGKGGGTAQLAAGETYYVSLKSMGKAAVKYDVLMQAQPAGEGGDKPGAAQLKSADDGGPQGKMGADDGPGDDKGGRREREREKRDDKGGHKDAAQKLALLYAAFAQFS